MMPFKASLSLNELFLRPWRRLRQIKDKPNAIAGGVAIGIFFGFTPFLGTKTVLSLFCAWVLRCNKVAAVIAVSFHDILAPLLPVMLRWEYDVGFWIIHNPHRLPKNLRIEDVRFSYWFHFRTLDILWPIFIGSLIFAIPSSLLSYGIAKLTFEYLQRKQRGPANFSGSISR